MFTGIIEVLGKVLSVEAHKTNIELTIQSSITPELKIDQSVAHNGVCLTVTDVSETAYKVTAIKETLDKTTIGDLKVGDEVNLERCMKADGRFDGHIVQGHVDQIGTCESVINESGSWMFTFGFDASLGNIVVEKGSICINGISLTVVNAQKNKFSVAIIPYTYENTNLKEVKIRDKVNLEFDIIGKYIKSLNANF